MKRKSLFIFVPILFAALFFACENPVGGGSNGSATPTPTAEPTPTPTAANAAWFIKQGTNDTTTTATLSGGVLTLHNTSSGNAYKSDAILGTTYSGSVAFIAFPTKLSGDFSVEADITVNTQNAANNASGIGVGAFDGFTISGNYALVLMRNSNNAAQGYYVKGAGSVGTGGLSAQAYTAGSQVTVKFARAGNQFTMAAGPTGGTLVSASAGVGNFYVHNANVSGSVTTPDLYAGLTFANVDATVSRLVITDAAGATVWSAATGTLQNFVPSSLTVGATAVDLVLGASSSVTATAIAEGGAVTTVSASSSDSTIVSPTVSNGDSGSTISFTGLKAGTATVTVTHGTDAGKTASFTVTVNDFASSDSYGTIPASRFYPAAGASSAYTDGELALTFDSAPTLNTGGSIRIYKKSDGSLVDTLGFSGEAQTAWGTTMNVGSQLVRQDGSTLYITPHFGKLAYGTEYYVGIPTTSITGTFNGAAFNGFSNLSTVATWSFTTRAAPTLTAGNVTVDNSQSGTADFRSIQGALDYLATGLSSATDVTLNLAAWTYRELVYYKGAKNITIAGPNGNNRGDNCLIQYNNSESLNTGTHSRNVLYFSGTNVVLKNISVKNTAVRATGGQAETIYFANGGTLASAKTLAVYNSSFYSNQDTIHTSGKNWFYDCYIEGNVDYIWGEADVALFENCELRSVNDGANASYIFAARTGSTSAGTVGKGYVLLNSTVAVDAGFSAYYARNPGSGAWYDQVALINVAFSGAGTLGSGLWYSGSGGNASPTKLGDSTYVGWKAVGCTGLTAASDTPYANSAPSIAGQSSEYDTRDHILNRVITVSGGSAAGYEAAAATWDVANLAANFGL